LRLYKSFIDRFLYKLQIEIGTCVLSDENQDHLSTK